MIRLLPVLLALLMSYSVQAQLLKWSPDFPVENDNNQSLVITLDATKGNRDLMGYTPTSDVYVHIGVITNLSTGPGDWKYVKFTWGSTAAGAKAEYVSANTWQFTIQGSLKTYFGITNANERIERIAVLFRNGNGGKVHRNADGSDMYVPVYTGGLAVRINEPFSEPKFQPVPETQTWVQGSSFNVKAAASKPSALKLYHNGAVIASATNATSVTGSSTITAEGLQQIVAEANDGAAVKYDTLKVFVAPAISPVAALPGGVKDGINFEPGDTSVTLVLFAPGKNLAMVLGDFNNWTEDTRFIMKRTPDGQRFWIRLTGLTPGQEYGYQFKVDNIKIADYYAHKVLDPWNDQYITAATYPNLKPYPTGKTTGIVSVLQTAAPAYNWAVPNFSRPDKRGLVIYELHLRDFIAAQNWQTLTDTLSYLKRLGVNAIELLPFNEFEGNNSWGYNPNFYFAPDKAYGTANALKRFIDSCHRNGMAVIMDMVLNHSFGSSPMVQLYANSNGWPTADNPWFNPDQNPGEGGYQGKHPFGVGYDFNHESAATQYFTKRVVEYWLKEFKIDGYRFDLSKGFTQVYTGDDVGRWSQYDASRIAIWKKYYDTIQAIEPNAYVILEHLSENSEEKELADYGMMFWGNMSHNYQEAAMGWLPQSNMSGGLHTVRNWSKPHLVSYMESHDEERIVFKNLNYGNAAGNYNIKDTATALKRMELDAAFFFTLPGPKMIWQFGELGYHFPINFCENGTINNDCRTNPKPIRWDFQNDPRRKQIYTTYSKLINLRFHPWYKEAFMSDKVEYNLNGGFKWIKVTTDTSNLVVVGNFDVSTATGSVTFPGTGTWFNLLKDTTFSVSTVAHNFTLQPGEFHVFVNRNVINRDTVRPPAVNVTKLEVKAYPNPALSTLNVAVKNPEEGEVSVLLYNSIGQYISTLHKGVLSKDEHRFVFERRNLRTGGGMYFIKVVTKSATQTVQLLFQ